MDQLLHNVYGVLSSDREGTGYPLKGNENKVKGGTDEEAIGDCEVQQYCRRNCGQCPEDKIQGATIL